MKEHWEKNLRLRMQGLRKEAPEGLLDEIKKEMVHRGIHLVPARKSVNMIKLWVFRSMAAAALLLGTIFLVKYSSEPYLHPFVNSNIQLTALTYSHPAAATALPVEAPKIQHPSLSGKIFSSNSSGPSLLSDTTHTAVNKIIPASSTAEAAITEKNERSAVSNGNIKKRQDHCSYNDSRYNTVSSAHKKQKSTLSFGTSYSGAFGITSNFGDQRLLATLDDPMPTDNFANNYSAKNSIIPPKTKTRTQHHLPIKIELSLKYHLNDRWSLQTGITYSYLSSDFTYRNNLSEDTYKQDLHYLGIPVAFSYDLLHNKRYAVYGTAGVEAAKMIDGHSTENRKQNKITENRLQYSANAALGAELKINRDLSFFTEPGISYYFNNGSQVENIYKAKPWNFNLNIGLRINITGH